VKGTAAAPRIVTLISVTWIHLFIHIGMIWLTCFFSWEHHTYINL
jgi:hypothetical protein